MLLPPSMSSREPAHPEELLLLDYVIGQLPAETRDQIKRHVSACRACSRTIDDLILTVDELDRLPTMPIPHDSPAAIRPPRLRPKSCCRASTSTWSAPRPASSTAWCRRCWTSASVPGA